MAYQYDICLICQTNALAAFQNAIEEPVKPLLATGLYTSPRHLLQDSI